MAPDFATAPKNSGQETQTISRQFHLETEKERDERISRQIVADISVISEVDAVSGVIKLLSLMHRSLYRPEPKIDVPINPPSQP
jgi:hypothetical protein